MTTEGKTIGQILFEVIHDRKPAVFYDYKQSGWTGVAPLTQEEWEVVGERFMQEWEGQKQKAWQDEYEYDRDNPKRHGKRIERIEASLRNHEQRLDGLADTVVTNESTLNMVRTAARRHEACIVKHSASLKGLDTVLAMARQHEAGLAEHSAGLRALTDALELAVDRLTEIDVELAKMREAMP